MKSDRRVGGAAGGGAQKGAAPKSEAELLAWLTQHDHSKARLACLLLPLCSMRGAGASDGRFAQ